METCFLISELPKEEQEPFKKWLFNMGKTQLVLNPADPYSYAYRVDYLEWKEHNREEKTAPL